MICEMNWVTGLIKIKTVDSEKGSVKKKSRRWVQEQQKVSMNLTASEGLGLRIKSPQRLAVNSHFLQNGHSAAADILWKEARCRGGQKSNLTNHSRKATLKHNETIVHTYPNAEIKHTGNPRATATGARMGKPIAQASLDLWTVQPLWKSLAVFLKAHIITIQPSSTPQRRGKPSPHKALDAYT